MLLFEMGICIVATRMVNSSQFYVYPGINLNISLRFLHNRI